MMQKKITWSKELVKLTLETLKNIPVASFIYHDRCHLKHCDDAREHDYGTISLENCLKKKYLIENEQGLYETYIAPESLVKAGWVVD